MASKLDFMSRAIEEQTKTFSYVDPVFLGNTKHVTEKKLDIKRPQGAVQRLLQKLENNDEREIINNLKEVYLCTLIFQKKKSINNYIFQTHTNYQKITMLMCILV